MHLIQLLLPRRDAAGHPFERERFEAIRAELTERFGGVTAYTRAPADGQWTDPSGVVAHDEVFIVEVMCKELDRSWWSAYRQRLTVELEQQELIVRALPIETL